MTRTLAIAQAATGALLLAGCSDSTRTMDNGSDSRGAYASSGAYRYDEQGNRVYDQSYSRNADGSMTRQRDSFTSTDSDGVVKSHYGADGLSQNDRPVWDRDPATSRQNDTPVYNRDLNDKSRTYTSDRTSNGSGNGRDRLTCLTFLYQVR